MEDEILLAACSLGEDGGMNGIAGGPPNMRMDSHGAILIIASTFSFIAATGNG